MCVPFVPVTFTEPRKSSFASSLHRRFPCFGLPKAHTNLNLALAALPPWIWASETLLLPTQVGRQRGWQLGASWGSGAAGRAQAPGAPGGSGSAPSAGPSAQPPLQGPDNELSSAAPIRAVKGPGALERNLVSSCLQASPGGGSTEISFALSFCSVISVGQSLSQAAS